jgi:hypothetical protein
MRDTLNVGCTLALILGMVTIPIQAETKKSATAAEQYRTWTAIALGGNRSTQHYCLSVVARRLDANAAAIDVVIAGSMSGYSLNVRPVRSVGDVRDLEGESMTVRSDATVSTDATSNAQLQADVEPETNGIEVQLVAANQAVNLTLLIPLSTAGESGALGFAIPPQSGCPQCFTATLICGGCSTSKYCKYCQPNCEANYYANCASCTISCSCGVCRDNP